jgi:hypothetical protein
MTNHLVLILVLILSACGKAVFEDDDDRREEVTVDGTYSAILIPVNGRISANLHGEAKVLKYGDEFRVTLELKNAPRAQYTQHLHSGSFCPKGSADANGDGYVDGSEARRHTGPVIVPLDGDLSAQGAGAGHRLTGSYRYSRTTSYYLMLADLHLPDEIVNDPVVKLATRDLPLERRAVSVYVRYSVRPGSTIEDVPVACGLLTRISDYPIPDESWERDGQEGRRRPRRVPRAPRPRPRPHPESDPGPEPVPYDSWWDRIRDRWWRWRGDGAGPGG